MYISSFLRVFEDVTKHRRGWTGYCKNVPGVTLVDGAFLSGGFKSCCYVSIYRTGSSSLTGPMKVNLKRMW